MNEQFVDVGDTVRMKTTPVFTNEDGEPEDPAVVKLVIRRAGEPASELSYPSDGIVKDGTGNYHFDFVVVRTGKHYYRWVGSGGVTAAAENSFTARSSF